MKRLTVYEKPTCTTCRRLAALLTERGIDFERIDYTAEPLTENQLRALLQKAGLRPRDVVRTKEPGARVLPIEDDEARVGCRLPAVPELMLRNRAGWCLAVPGKHSIDRAQSAQRVRRRLSDFCLERQRRP